MYFFPQRCIKEIAEGIIRHEDVALLLQCLNSVSDIPEESLCSLINFILGQVSWWICVPKKCNLENTRNVGDFVMHIGRLE